MLGKSKFSNKGSLDNLTYESACLLPNGPWEHRHFNNHHKSWTLFRCKTVWRVAKNTGRFENVNDMRRYIFDTGWAVTTNFGAFFAINIETFSTLINRLNWHCGEHDGFAHFESILWLCFFTQRVLAFSEWTGSVSARTPWQSCELMMVAVVCREWILLVNVVRC